MKVYWCWSLFWQEHARGVYGSMSYIKLRYVYQDVFVYWRRKQAQ